MTSRSADPVGRRGNAVPGGRPGTLAVAARGGPTAVGGGGCPPARVALAALAAAVGLLPLLPGGLRPFAVPDQLALRVLSVVLLATAALILVTGLPDARRGLARWRLGPWLLLWTAVTYGVASVTWFAPQEGVAAQIALESVVKALAVVAVAVVVWAAGYCAGVPAVVRAAARRGLSVLLRGTGTGLPGAAAPWLAYGVGTAARLVGVALSGRFGYVGDPRDVYTNVAAYANILHVFSVFALFGIAAAAYRAFSRPAPGRLVTLLTLLGIEAAVGALAGGKQYFILAVLAVLIPYSAVRGRVPAGILAVATLLFLWVVVPFNVAYRDFVRGPEAHLPVSGAVAAAPRLTAEVVAADPPLTTVGSSAEQMLRRVRQSDGLAVVVQRTPETIPYRSPWEFAYAPLIGVVPRAVWPDKPVLATGYEFNQEYYGLPSDLYSSASVTPLGDLYRHGGWATVVVGMVLVGAGCRLFDQLLRVERDPRAVCFLLVLLPVIGRTGSYDLLVSLPTGLLTAVLGARLVFRRAGEVGR